MERFGRRIPGKRNRYERHLRRIISEYSHSQLKVVNFQTFFHCNIASIFPPLEFRQVYNCFDQKSVTSVLDSSLRELAASTWSLRALSRHVALEILPERTQEEHKMRSRSRWRGAQLSAAFLPTLSWPQTQDRIFFFFNLPSPFENTMKSRSITQQSSIGIPDSHVKNDKIVVVLSH